MKVYKAECREVLTRFFDGRLSGAECIAGLDSALAGVIPDLDPADLPTVQSIMVENYRILDEVVQSYDHSNKTANLVKGLPQFA